MQDIQDTIQGFSSYLLSKGRKTRNHIILMNTLYEIELLNLSKSDPGVH